MAIKDTLVGLRTQVFNQTEALIKFIAGFFGYPENHGMPIFQDNTIKMASERNFLDSLPEHISRGWPMQEEPETFTQMLFGTKPQLDPIERIIYESPKEGYYNFYIQNFKNLYFLPDWLSEFLQIRLHFCLDITYLEMIRESLFLAIVIYGQMLTIRLALYWYMTINPYTRPWIYFIALTDWTQDALTGFIPSILGVDLTPSIIIGITGKLADSLNHLVFTMPFLPSEGERGKMIIDGELKNVLVFRYLPILWYRHPIPDNIREFWYTQRPEILKYMQKNYKDLGIEFLPNQILKETYQSQHSLIDNTDMINDLSTQLLSNSDIFHNSEFSNLIIHSPEQFHYFFLTHFDKLTF